MMDGKISFKVKGVNTSKAGVENFKYEDLAATFITKTSVKFTNQTQFRRLPKVQGAGITIIENLIKEYTLATNCKRR